MRTHTKVSPWFIIQQFFWNAIDWLYPPSCASCGTSGVRLCADCIQQITPIDHLNSCTRCDLPNSQYVCQDCQSQPPSFQQLRSYGRYEGVLRKTIHHLKYHNDLPLADTLCRLLVATFQQQNWEIDLICPVPLSRARLRQRGYNQSALLAQILAWAVSIPYNDKALLRTRDTLSQVGLNAEQRRANVRDAFRANANLVKDKTILVVDDIATTSATLSACADALKTAGANRVYAITLARTAHHHPN